LPGYLLSFDIAESSKYRSVTVESNPTTGRLFVLVFTCQPLQNSVCQAMWYYTYRHQSWPSSVLLNKMCLPVWKLPSVMPHQLRQRKRSCGHQVF